jgi:hydroxymethylglutaryl-CoA reductase
LPRDPEAAFALARRIVEASVFAERDPYRAATHNKGIMNGVDAVLLAFGQDTRAVEAGAHAYAARSGRYTALSRFRIDGETLVGDIELPMAVGTVGGVASAHPTVAVARQIADITRASELASIATAVGLAQNLAALRALAGEGIQSGHMRLHARKSSHPPALEDEVADAEIGEAAKRRAS